MGKIKDLLYDISDILTAICIVGIASLIIWFSISNIMEYPSIVSAQQQNEENQNFGLAVPVGDNTSTDSAIDSETETANTDTTTGSAVDVYSIYINYGEATSTIAQKFVDVGFFDSVEEFNTLVTQMNAASSIKAGNFIIPSNATPEEVIKEITNASGL